MKGTFRWFVLAVVALWVIWLMTGGPARYENKTNQFIDQPTTPGNSGKIYNKTELDMRLGR